MEYKIEKKVFSITKKIFFLLKIFIPVMIKVTDIK